MKRAEAEIIRKTLHKTNWNRAEAAGILGISYKALLYKIKGFGLSKAENEFAFPPAEISTGHLGIPSLRPSEDR